MHVVWEFWLWTSFNFHVTCTSQVKCFLAPSLTCSGSLARGLGNRVQIVRAFCRSAVWTWHETARQQHTARAVNRITIIMSNFDITLLVATKLNRSTALRGRKMQSVTIATYFSLFAAAGSARTPRWRDVACTNCCARTTSGSWLHHAFRLKELKDRNYFSTQGLVYGAHWCIHSLTWPIEYRFIDSINI